MADLSLSQSMQLKQSLALSQRMLNSLDILQYTALDLKNLVREKLNSNPLIEEVQVEVPAQKKEEYESSYDNFKSYNNYSNTLADANTYDFIVNSIEDKTTLREELIRQASLDCDDIEVLKAFVAECECLDERGFLAENDLYLLENEFDKDILAKALELLQSMEPAGIGAKDLRDCFLIQLLRMDQEYSLAYEILDDQYELFTKRKVQEISKNCNVSVAQVEGAILLISKLDTAPARSYYNESSNYVWADARIFRDKYGKLACELTNNHIPQIRINDSYRQMIAENKFSKEDKSYIKEKMTEAKSLMGAIEDRQSTLLRITNFIIEKQEAFFSGGELKPMTMAEVAQALELHPSTISRALAGKNVETAKGLKDYKSFFSNAIETKGGSESLSSDSIKEAIQRIVDSENTRKPYSDSQISEMLAKDNMNIARRTVAKYREELLIPSKTLRKRFN
ncbi:MAG: RNA polymerase factor sigma-54 [Opitutales bacterium]